MVLFFLIVFIILPFSFMHKQGANFASTLSTSGSKKEFDMRIINDIQKTANIICFLEFYGLSWFFFFFFLFLLS